MSKPTVVVFGATGNQGKWACEAFAQAGWRVVGISRDASKVPANCETVATADLEDAKSVERVCKDADAVFGVTQPFKPNGSVDEFVERRQAEGLVRGVKAAGVKHLIYSSIVSVKRWEKDEFGKLPHLRQKYRVNELCTELGVPMTMLGPTHFVDMWASPFMSVTLGALSGFVPEDIAVPYVACRDIGRMAVVAAKMGPPAAHERRYLPVVTDFVKGSEIRRMLEKWHRQPFSYSSPPGLVLKLFAHEMYEMRLFFEGVGADKPASEEWGRTRAEFQSQMEETRRLLGGDYWTVEQWFRYKGYDKKLQPTPTPFWKKAIVPVAIAAGAALLYWFWK